MNWQRKLLKDVVVDWIKGSTPNRAHEEYYMKEPGVPWVKVSDLQGRDLQVTENYLTPEGAQQVRRWVPENAVLLSVSGTIGKAAIARERLMVNQAVQAMVFDENIVLPEYAYYYFQFFRPWLETMANIVTIPNLTKSRLENTYILFPRIEEQKYIVRIMKSAEDMVEKQRRTYQEAERILCSIMERKRRDSLDGNRTYELQDCLEDSIISVSPMGAGHYAVRSGDIIIRQRPSKKDENYLLVTETTDLAAIGGKFLCVSLNRQILRPEVFLGWLHFASKYLDFHTVSLNSFMAARMEIPEALTGTQNELVSILQKIFVIQDKAKKIEEKAERFYQSMLTVSFTARLSKNYRTVRRFEEPDEDFILWHYNAKIADIETDTIAKNINPDERFQEGQRKIIELLSDFQKEILYKYLEREKTPMPIHAVLKKLKVENKTVCEGYSIQDAIAAVKILEKLGFLEKTIPEKLFLGKNEITDLRGNVVTIQKYRAAFDRVEE